MIPLNTKNILPATENHLTTVQGIITNEVTYEAKIKRAISRWDNKTSSNAARAAFDNVKSVLKDMCSGASICVYCEHNEATDIEHIYPKRLYPEKAFTWANYVFACGNCNSRYKADNFKIFNPAGTIIIQDITPKVGVYLVPTNEDALFINQRSEDPMALLELDIISRQFIFREIYPQGTREYEKAKYTKDLLDLNGRQDLVRQRKAAHKWYLHELRNYIRVKSTANFNELIIAVNGESEIDSTEIDETAVFAIEKQKILDSIKNDILTHSHPTVWRELIRQRTDLPKTNLLLGQALEVLTW